MLRAGSQSALTRRVGNEFELLSHTTPEAWGLHARSKEQRFALELLLDPAIEVVALDGRAGTGKTLLAIAAGVRAGRRAEPIRAGRGLPAARAGRPSRRGVPARRSGGEARPVDVRDPRRGGRAHRPHVERRRATAHRGAHEPGSVVAGVGDVPPRPVTAAPDRRASTKRRTSSRPPCARSSHGSGRAPRSSSPATRARSTPRISASRTTRWPS